MSLRSALLALASLTIFFIVSSAAQTLTPTCTPKVEGPLIVDNHDQIHAAGLRAEPPVTYNGGGYGFAWPDTAMGAIKTANGYEFFGSDGGFHARQFFEGQWFGNNNWGSVVMTVGTLDNPVGTGDPLDVTISPNPDPGINPNYSSYGYIGGGPVFRVPDGMTGAGNLLVGYHAELPNNTLYAVHGLAASWDNGRHWTDLGEVVRPNQSYAANLPGFDEIGDGPLVLSPDRRYFYFYFPEWPAGATASTPVSVARSPVDSVLSAAFGPGHPHAVQFEKFYQGTWNLQPGIGGASTNLFTSSAQQYSGYLDVHYNSAIQRYVMITSDDTNFAYYESVDGLTWTNAQYLGAFGNPGDGHGTIAPYPFSIGLGDDPSILGKSWFVYYTHLEIGNSFTERAGDSLRRLTLTCQ